MLLTFNLTPTKLKLKLYTHFQAETSLEIAWRGVLKDVKRSPLHNVQGDVDPINDIWVFIQMILLRAARHS